MGLARTAVAVQRRSISAGDSLIHEPIDGGRLFIRPFGWRDGFYGWWWSAYIGLRLRRIIPVARIKIVHRRFVWGGGSQPVVLESFSHQFGRGDHSLALQR